MAITIEITHPLPPGHEDAEPVAIFIQDSGPAAGSWIIHLYGRKRQPVIELLRANNVPFGFNPEGGLYSVGEPLPPAVIGELARLQYTFR